MWDYSVWGVPCKLAAEDKHCGKSQSASACSIWFDKVPPQCFLSFLILLHPSVKTYPISFWCFVFLFHMHRDHWVWTTEHTNPGSEPWPWKFWGIGAALRKCTQDGPPQVRPFWGLHPSCILDPGGQWAASELAFQISTWWSFFLLPSAKTVFRVATHFQGQSRASQRLAACWAATVLWARLNAPSTLHNQQANRKLC